MSKRKVVILGGTGYAQAFSKAIRALDKDYTVDGNGLMQDTRERGITISAKNLIDKQPRIITDFDKPRSKFHK